MCQGLLKYLSKLSKNLFLKRCLGYLLSPFAPLPSHRRVVLIYHAIGNTLWSVSEKNFAQQMEWLNSNATVVSLSELLKNNEHDGIQVAITFDDGYDSVHNIAFPEMDKFGFTGTVYLNTGMIDDDINKSSIPDEGHYQNTKFMNWYQVHELGINHWNIGSHGVQHFDLCNMDERQVEAELSQSKAEIQQRLDKNCDDFSYTWGSYNEKLKKQVEAAGYLSSVSGEHGPITNESEMFAIPRIDIRQDYSINDFSDVVKGRWDFLKTLQTLRHK